MWTRCAWRLAVVVTWAARIAALVLIVPGLGMVHPFGVGETAQWAALRCLEAVPCASSFAMVVGLLRTRPPVRLKARNGGAEVCRCNGLRIYHHLPLIYQFSNDWAFVFGVYAVNCWIFADKGD